MANDMDGGSLKIDYVEFGSSDLSATQTFFGDAFGWTFTDYGDHYRDISGAGLGGGLHDEGAGPPLVILKTDDLENALTKVREAGAEITQDIFEFPGGRRFHFTAPGGVKLAIWTEG